MQSHTPSHDDPGLAVIDSLYRRMQVETRWSQRTERGLTWWPSRLAQRIWAEPPARGLVRVHIQSDLLRDVPVNDESLVTVGRVSGGANLSAVILEPDGHLRLHACLAVSADQLDAMRWVALHAALLQVCEAEGRADSLSARLGATIDATAPPKKHPRRKASQVLGVVRECSKPQRQPPRLDFEALAHSERGPWVAVTTRPNGLSAEVPFFGPTPIAQKSQGPPETALLWVKHAKHPNLGHGVVVVLMLPVKGDAEHANRLNRAEVHEHTGIAQLGSWTPDVSGALGCCAFLPAITVKSSFVYVLLWQMANRAIWARDVLFPRQPVEHTNALAFVGSALAHGNGHSLVPLNDADELCAFAGTHETLASVWDECYRVDWLLWLLEHAQVFGLVDGYDLAALASRFQVTRRDTTSPSWLTVMQVQAHRLRQVIGNPFADALSCNGNAPHQLIQAAAN